MLASVFSHLITYKRDDVRVTGVNLDLPKAAYVVHVHSCLLGNMSNCKGRILQLSIDTVIMQ